MPTFSNGNLTAKVKEDLGVDTTGQDFLPFSDLKQSVRNSDLIPDDIVVSGAIYDVSGIGFTLPRATPSTASGDAS